MWRRLVSVRAERFGGSEPFSTITVFTSARSLQDLISMTLMKGSGLLDELDSLIGLLGGGGKRREISCFYIEAA